MLGHVYVNMCFVDIPAIQQRCSDLRNLSLFFSCLFRISIVLALFFDSNKSINYSDDFVRKFTCFYSNGSAQDNYEP